MDAARRRGLDPQRNRVSFHVTDLVADASVFARHEPDWVCLSGTLNTMDENTARRLVEAAFDAAAQGVVFNFLSDRFLPRWEGRDLAPAHRFDTAAWLSWAMTLTSRVSFTQTYLDGHDATLMIVHDGDPEVET